MIIGFEYLKEIYEEILEINSDIFSLLELDKKEELEELFLKKNRLIHKVSRVKKQAEMSDEEKKILNSLIVEIKKKDAQMIEILDTQKKELKEKLVNVAKDSRLTSAYTIRSNEPEPRLFDSKE